MREHSSVLIENWLPVRELGIESRRERAAASALPPLSFLHVWWARRPLAASAGAVLGSVMPAWTKAIRDAFPNVPELATEVAYREWFLRLCGILGDPVAAREQIDDANARGERLIGNGYGYPQAYKNSPSTRDLAILHEVLLLEWGALPNVIDPTAGGGSIPYTSIRYGLPSIANDLNPIAASVLRAGVEIPAEFGTEIVTDLERWGSQLVSRINERMVPAFSLEDSSEQVIAYIFARSVACPRTGKQVPLAPNWWLSKSKGGTAVKLITERHGMALDDPEFEIVNGKAIDFNPDEGTISRGAAISPWDGLAIPGDYIKSEAQEGRMGSVLYAVAIRTNRKRAYRAPSRTDLDALKSAEAELERRLPEWEACDVLPTEEVPMGNDSRPHQYGMSRWREMFSPRQLLAHGTFIEEFRRIAEEIRAAEEPARASVLLALLAMMQGKALNWNSHMSSWDVSREKMRSVFDRHDFAFKWTFGEFDAARELMPWCLSQLLDSYRGIAELLQPSDAGTKFAAQVKHSVPGSVRVIQGSAGNLHSVSTGSQAAVCIDPPYYDNVMYAELSDYFYVWEKRTLGLVWPEFFREVLTDKKNEAVANPARFRSTGRRKNELATADYEAKMTAIFAEAHRVLQDDGVLTVMFTHKKAEAWDTLGTSLMDAGFSIETSWPVPTESDVSLHQAKKNAAASTIFLVCRKRANRDDSVVFFEDIEGEVRSAARQALERFTSFGIDGVDLLLSTYGPALSVISSHWPVYSSEADELTGDNRLLRPEEALGTAREELVRLQRQRLVGRAARLDDLTDFTLLAWEIFKAREFPFDEARRLALAVGGMDVEELERARILTKKSGTVVLLEPSQRVRRRSAADEALPGVQVDATGFEHVIDAVHTAMHLTSQDGPAAAKQWLERIGLAKDARILAAFQGLLNAIPRTKKKDVWLVPEAGWLDELAVFLDGVDIPLQDQRDEAEQVGLWENDEDGEE